MAMSECRVLETTEVESILRKAWSLRGGPSMRLPLNVLLLFIMLITAVSAGDNEGSGTVTVDGRTFKIKSAMATWHARSRTLTLSFFPFDLTRQQLEWLRKTPYDYVVADSPAQRPFVRMALSFDDKSSSLDEVDFVAITFWRMSTSTLSHQRTRPHLASEMSVRGDFRRGESIQVRTASKVEVGLGSTRKVKWSIRARCKVLLVPDRQGALGTPGT